MKPPACTVVIATLDRPESLERVLVCLAGQTQPAESVILVDASSNAATEALAARWSDRLPLVRLPSSDRSAARQRNTGAALATTPLVAFMDDDIAFPSDHLEKLLRVFADDNDVRIAGVSARENNSSHPPPRGLLWWYYRLQAGYRDPHYGARLFGPAINCVPCYSEQAASLIPAEWLPSTCVVYRRELFLAEKFPDFDEYSSMEDVHLSTRLARRGRLFFHAEAPFDHYSGSSRFKRDPVQLARHRWRNRRRVCREVLGLEGPALHARLLLHRLFVSAFLLRSRPPGWTGELRGTWI
jgi:GT2 family glycosyltransferase